MANSQPPVSIPAEPSFLSKWTLVKFTDTEYQKWNALTFREFTTDINSRFARLDTLNTNQVRGSVFRVPYLVLLDGQLTVPTALIPPRFRISGMEAQATNGTDQTSAQFGVVADPVRFKLIAHPLGAIDALVDEKATTTATVRGHWVRTSGTDAEKIASYPALPLEDTPLKKGSVYQYTFVDLVPPVARLIEVRENMNLSQNPLPTGLDTDPYYKPFAPLKASSGYDDTAVVMRLDLLDQAVDNHEDRLDTAEGLLAALQSGKVELWKPGAVYVNRVYLLVSGIGTGLYQPKADYGFSSSVSLTYYTRVADFRYLPSSDFQLQLTDLYNNKASIFSPAFSGVPTAPTAAYGATGNQLATVDFVNNTQTTAPALVAYSPAGAVNTTFTNLTNALSFANGGGRVVVNRPSRVVAGNTLVGGNVTLDLQNNPLDMIGAALHLYEGSKVINNKLIFNASEVFIRNGGVQEIQGGIVASKITFQAGVVSKVILDKVLVTSFFATPPPATVGAFEVVLRNGSSFFNVTPDPATTITVEQTTGATSPWPAFTNGIVDDVNKVFRATAPASFRSARLFYTLDGGVNKTALTDAMRSGDVFTLPVSGAKAAGTVGFGVYADFGRAESPIVYNATAFTAPVLAPAGYLSAGVANFDTPLTDANNGWQNFNAWNISGGKALASAGATFLVHNFYDMPGDALVLRLNITRSEAGPLRIYFDGNQTWSNGNVAGTGLFEFVLPAWSGGLLVLNLSGQNGFVGDIDWLQISTT
ncbi:hypothetical protein MUN81_10395 [Hymenobacter sp. 5317J-9]|uniref:hypothetical protein n=1 Tax=Hymenobacter sp. 5317J-9 TaxID=2932250 RepID=UPI001FD70F3F|nr:hypothetical protein [Hymenobacter sp. 5317J-9]UOQ99888.1 hypothetical protein MUN81_10395 [Hymenobacter sp. 5317J-9]